MLPLMAPASNLGALLFIFLSGWFLINPTILFILGCEVEPDKAGC